MNQLGRLTLSWFNKERALLGTEAGGYTWVDQDDPGVTEGRLLESTETVGQVGSGISGASDTCSFPATASTLCGHLQACAGGGVYSRQIGR
jgi:hypothetical protein